MNQHIVNEVILLVLIFVHLLNLFTHCQSVRISLDLYKDALVYLASYTSTWHSRHYSQQGPATIAHSMANHNCQTCNILGQLWVGVYRQLLAWASLATQDFTALSKMLMSGLWTFVVTCFNAGWLDRHPGCLSLWPSWDSARFDWGVWLQQKCNQTSESFVWAAAMLYHYGFECNTIWYIYVSLMCQTAHNSV